MSYPPHLLDALGRVHAEAALDRLIRDEIALQAGLNDKPKENDVPPPVDAEKEVSLDGPVSDESSDNLNQPSPEPRP